MISIRNRDRFNDLFWGPWGELDRFQREIDQLFFNNAPLTYRTRGAVASNVYSDEDRAVAQIAVPGFKNDELQISVEGKTLTVSGKRKEWDGENVTRREFGAEEFQRGFELPFAIDANAVSAKLENGVLQIELPRAEADKPRRIEIR